MSTYRISSYDFCPWIVSEAKIQFIKQKKIVGIIWISYNFQIQNKIVSAKTICGNTVPIKIKTIILNKFKYKF